MLPGCKGNHRYRAVVAGWENLREVFLLINPASGALPISLRLPVLLSSCRKRTHLLVRVPLVKGNVKSPGEVVPKDGNLNPRKARAYFPPIAGGRKARRYAMFETVLIMSMCISYKSNELMSQPPRSFNTITSSLPPVFPHQLTFGYDMTFHGFK